LYLPNPKTVCPNNTDTFLSKKRFPRRTTRFGTFPFPCAGGRETKRGRIKTFRNPPPTKAKQEAPAPRPARACFPGTWEAHWDGPGRPWFDPRRENSRVPHCPSRIACALSGRTSRCWAPTRFTARGATKKATPPRPCPSSARLGCWCYT
jgi:hypothetical protein